MTSTLGDALLRGELYSEVAFSKERLQKCPGLFGCVIVISNMGQRSFTGPETQHGIVVSTCLNFLVLQNRVTKPSLCSGKGPLAHVGLQGLASIWEAALRGLRP